MTDSAELAARLTNLRSRIEMATANPESVTVVAVTKKFPTAIVQQAQRLGLNQIGENYAQELLAKAEELSGLDVPQPSWHFIGKLQRNKVKKLAPYVYLWQTIDRPELLIELSRRAPGAKVLIQVNATQEDHKAGCAPAEAPRLVEQGRELGLDVAGLMTLGPSDGGSPEAAFSEVRELASKCEVQELSMGMSADLELAIAAGATIIRVGSGLFGPRSSP